VKRSLEVIRVRLKGVVRGDFIDKGIGQAIDTVDETGALVKAQQ
jgi:hypothetical protein